MRLSQQLLLREEQVDELHLQEEGVDGQ